jgi:hypothetical protein
MVDFHRLNHIRHVIETDYNSWSDVEVASEAKCNRYEMIMAQILALPVSAYVEPAPVCGEIEAPPKAKKETNMWNQNGNGQGNGNSNDVYDRLNNAKQLTNRDPYVEAGTHTLAVVTLEEFQHETGAAVRGTFLVLESTSMKPGTACAEVWMLQKPAPKVGMTTDSDRFADFCCRLKGAPAGYAIGPDIRTLLRDRGAEQLARGMVIRCVGIVKVSETTGKSYTVKNWSNIEQTPQAIAGMRQKIESQPGLVKAPRTQNGYPNTQNGQAMQGPPQSPYAQPQNAYAPPQAYPQPQQQQSVSQAPQGVPPGGFLANVPPQGNNGGNPQGGNGNQGGW